MLNPATKLIACTIKQPLQSEGWIDGELSALIPVLINSSTNESGMEKLVDRLLQDHK